jgi:uncharacterized protein
MLYDNAQLSRLYLHVWQMTGDVFFRQIAESIYDYILREMTSPEGGFYSTTDADSEGEEGKFFLWSQSELEQVLGEDARIAIDYWGVTPDGNFEGQNILFVPDEDSVVADRLGLSVDALHERLAVIKSALYAHREQRAHPGLDDKILTAWNGMMLASLAEAARVLNRPDYRDAAVRNGDFILRELVTDDGRLLRTYKNGEARINGYLEDYANLIDALLELYQMTFDERWFVMARRLADVGLEHFPAGDGGFFDTSDDHESLIVRPRNVQDNATPAGSSMMARQLIRLAAYTGESHYDEAGRGALRLLTEALRQYPQAFGEALNGVDMIVCGLTEVAAVGSPDDKRTAELLSAIHSAYRPNMIVALSPHDVEADAVIPLLSQRFMQNGQPTVYVCRNFACKMPVTAPEAVEKLLAEQP